MSRDKIKALINKLKDQMQERKPYESIPYNLNEIGDTPASMRPVTSGSQGELKADLATQTVERVTAGLPEECQGSVTDKAISQEVIIQEKNQINISGLIKDAAEASTSKNIGKISELINNSSVRKLMSDLTNKPDKIIYDKILSDMCAMFLSDNPNDYIAAMLGMAQDSVNSDVESISREIDDIKKMLTSYISSMKAQVEHLAEVRTFPNLIKILIDMQFEMKNIIQGTAALQSRIFTAGDFSKARLNSLSAGINSVLRKNSIIKTSLGIYNPNAEMDCDLKGFGEYLKKRVEKLIQKVKNIGDFKKAFQAEINPLDIFYKNFSRLYEYLCQASLRINNSATGWRSSNINTLKENCLVINDNLCKSLVIIDKYRRSNMMIDTEEEHSGTVIGRLMKSLAERIGSISTASLLASLNELLYVINAAIAQGMSLIHTPFLAFRDEIIKRDIPDRILSLINFDAIKSMDWGNTLNFDKYLKVNLKGLAMDKLIQKCSDINIPIDKLPDLGTLDHLWNRAKSSCDNLKEELHNFNDVVNDPSQPSFKSVVPEKVSNAVQDMSSLSPALEIGFKEADTDKVSSALSSSEHVTAEGSLAADLKKGLGDIGADDEAEISVTEKDAINRAITLLTGDHIQQCADALLKTEGFGESLTFMTDVDEYVTEVYDNVNSIIDWLVQLTNALESNSSEES